MSWPGLVLRETLAVPLDAAAIERALETFAPAAAAQTPDPVQLLLESMGLSR